MDMLKYLHESNKTAAFATPDLSCFNGDQRGMLRASLDIVQGGVGGDLLKRAVFYSDPKIQERAQKAAEAVDKLAQKLDSSVGRDLTEKEMELWHAACGLASEAGEIMQEIIEASLEEREIKIEGKGGMIEETGDCLWYLALAIRWIGNGQTFESIGGYNIAKLTARYPQRFTKDAALNRDLDAEKVALTEKNSVAANG